MDETKIPQPYDRKARELIELARNYADNASAPNTTRTYESLWDEFREFCKRFHASALPAHPATVVAHISELARAGYKLNTLETKLAAIRHFHIEARAEDPTADNAVRKVLDGIRRTIGANPTRKAAIDLDDWRAMILKLPKTLRGTRDAAMLLICYACALRRSELVALRVKDVAFFREHMVVTIQRSKTDPTGESYEINVPRAEDEIMCPVRALQTWLTISGICTGFIFRKIDRWEHIGETGLTDQVVADVVKAAAASIGIDPALVSGHTPRRSLITAGAKNQEQTGSIRKVSRHKTEVMVDAYRADTAEAQMRVIGGALGNGRRRRAR